MSNKERDVDSMKYRKSTHLAGVDVEMIIHETGSCKLTIKDAYHARNIDVSGTKTTGYFIEFIEDIKPMMVNSGNRKNIGDIVRINNKLSRVDSRNLTNWIGARIELIFDPNVTMMGKVTGGIKVLPKSPIPDITDDNAVATLNESTTQEELKANWSKLSRDEQKLPTVNALKDKLKIEL